MTAPARRTGHRTVRMLGALALAVGTVGTGAAVIQWSTDSTSDAAPLQVRAASPDPTSRTTAVPTAIAPPVADPSTTAPPTHARAADADLGRLVWSDEFSGAAGTRPDPGHWQAQTGGNGWGNQELECNTDSADTSALDGDGHLAITARSTPGYRCPDGSTDDYTSARLSTVNLATLKYGKIRVRAQLPSASGLWPGIWALGQDHESVGWPQSGEIDVAEVVGKTPNTVYQTLHGPAPDGSPYSLGSTYSIGRTLGSGFHTYGVDWTPDRISFSVDGDVYVSYTRAEVEQHGTWEFDQPFYLLLDVAVGGTFPGPPEGTSQFPQQMLVDFVRIYD